MLYQIIVPQMNSATFLPIFSFFYADLDYICKIVNRTYKNYIIYISQINLSSSGPISETD